VPTTPTNLSCTVNGSVTSTFNVASATFTASNSLTLGGASAGPAAGKATFGAYKITKSSDACSIPLFTVLAKGTLVAGNLTINYYPAAVPSISTSPLPILTVILHNFAVTSLDLEGPTSEVFSIAYESIEIYDPATKTYFCWDQLTNNTGVCPIVPITVTGS
jgi:hypothetical protein